MAGMIGKRKQPFPSAGGRGKKPRRPRMHRTDHNGVAASNSSASHHAGQGNHADEASDDDLDTLPVPGDANAYSALLGALSSTTTRHADGRSPVAVAGKRDGKTVSASDGADKHPRRSTAADRSSPAHEAAKNSSRKRQTAAQKTVSKPGAERRSQSSKAAPRAVFHGTGDGSEAAAAARIPALDAVPVTNGSAESGKAAGDAHANGGGGWGLTLENDATDPGLGGDGAESLAQAAAADETPVQDFFSAHFDRWVLPGPVHSKTFGQRGPTGTPMLHTALVWRTHGVTASVSASCCNPTYICRHNMSKGPRGQGDLPKLVVH